MEEVISYIKKLNISTFEPVVLACSYGPDSMCLLDLLLNVGLNVVVAHVNHNLRNESVYEKDALSDYCKKNNLLFECAEIADYPHGNIEAYARKFRYDFFEKVLKKYNANYLFTAHHGDDLIETVLMRLSRGASFKGYSGFSFLSKISFYNLVRPLIFVTKDDIENYCKKSNISYAVDKSNYSLDYTRNKYRHKVLPALKEINPKIHKKFIKFSNTINEYNEYIEKEVDDLYSKLYLNNRIDLNEFNILPSLLKKNLLSRILFDIYDNNINKINDNHIDLILDLINSDKVNGYVCMPDSIKVLKYYNILEFEKNVSDDPYDFIFNDKLEVNGGLILQISDTNIIKSNYLIRLSSKDIYLPLRVRTRRVGDKMVLKNGTKKLGEILSENKMSKKERDNYPIVVDNMGNVLWIPGVKKSKFDKQYNEEYDIILKYIKKGEENEE